MTIRRLGLALSTIALTTGAAVAVATPAQAWDHGCSTAQGFYVDGAQNIHGYHVVSCETGQEYYKGVTIKRYVSPGVWDTVAAGYGFVDYYCNGHALNIFRVNNDEFFNTCG